MHTTFTISDKARLLLTLLMGNFLLQAGAQTSPRRDETILSCAPSRPLTTPSNEATKAQLALARAEGNAVDSCTDWIIHHAGTSVGHAIAGEYKITYAFTAAEGWYQFTGKSWTWNEPTDANVHLWVFIQDGGDGRITPLLPVRVKLVSANGPVLLDKPIEYAWMPLVNGYGDNFYLRMKSELTLILDIAPPVWHRHDPYNGDRFTKPVRLAVKIAVDPASLAHQPRFSGQMEKQHQLAAAPGNAYARTLKAMYKQANDGHDTVAEGYKAAVAVEYAEGYWQESNGKFRYLVENDLSGLTNAHVEVAPLDPRSGRFLEGCDVTASLFKDGRKIGTKAEPFMWHPWLYHYGENWRVPAAGKYRVEVSIKPPVYRRYGREDNAVFNRPADIQFDLVTIKTGQK